MSQALYRKWRPARFEDVVGQEHVTRTLRNAIAADRVGHAFLFSGPRGTGKTTTARLLAKAVNCKHEEPSRRPDGECSICQTISDGRFLDMIEIDAASNTSVEHIRDLRDKINFAPSEGRFKVYIIDEVHMLSIAAFNALLKTLEEPPPHAKFVLATTEEHKVPITIKSRCQLFQFRLLSTAEIVGRLRWLTEKERLKITPDALDLLARQGSGSLRDAESLLDQLASTQGDGITLEIAQQALGVAPIETMQALTEALLAGDGGQGLETIHQALSGGADARQFARQMVSYLRGILLLKTSGEDATLDMPADHVGAMARLAEKGERSRLVEAIRRFSRAAVAAGNSWQPQLPLELALIESLPAEKKEQAPEQIKAAPPVAPPPEAAPEQKPPPQKPAPEMPAAEMPAAAGGDLTLEKVTANWHELMNNIRQQDRNLSALMAACQPLGTEDNALILGFQFPMLKEKFEKNAKAVKVSSQALSELIGSPCQVKAVLTEHYRPASPQISPEAFQEFADQHGGVVQVEDEGGAASNE